VRVAAVDVDDHQGAELIVEGDRAKEDDLAAIRRIVPGIVERIAGVCDADEVAAEVALINAESGMAVPDPFAPPA